MRKQPRDTHQSHAQNWEKKHKTQEHNHKQ